MQLFEDILTDEVLSDFIVPECEDEGICVSFDEQVNREHTLIINVDAYYHSLHLEFAPPSIDCLIIQFCGEMNYKLYLVELKNVKKKVHIDRKNLEAKFETTLLDFLRNRFRYHFFNEAYTFKTKLLLSAGKMDNNVLIRSYSLDFLLGLRMFHFQEKRLGIDGIPPNPMINPC